MNKLSPLFLKEISGLVNKDQGFPNSLLARLFFFPLQSCSHIYSNTIHYIFKQPFLFVTLQLKEKAQVS